MIIFFMRQNHKKKALSEILDVKKIESVVKDIKKNDFKIITFHYSDVSSNNTLFVDSYISSKEIDGAVFFNNI